MNEQPTSNNQQPTANGGRKKRKQTPKGNAWRDRIVGHGKVDPAKLAAHPENYKAHPDGQRTALDAAIREVGFLRSVTVNRRTGTIIDGHLRVALAIERKQRKIRVEYVDLSKAEERAALTAMDPIGSLAEVDPEALEKLIDDIEAHTPDLAKALDEFRNAEEQAERPSSGGGAVPDTFEIHVTCRTAAEQRKLVDRWMKQGIQCKAVTF